MKLYAVAAAYEGIDSVFSTIELAQAYIAEHPGSDFYIGEIEIDNPDHWVAL